MSRFLKFSDDYLNSALVEKSRSKLAAMVSDTIKYDTPAKVKELVNIIKTRCPDVLEPKKELDYEKPVPVSGKLADSYLYNQEMCLIANFCEERIYSMLKVKERIIKGVSHSNFQQKRSQYSQRKPQAKPKKPSLWERAGETLKDFGDTLTDFGDSVIAIIEESRK